ncbi:MAG: hypothetical protein PWP64_501 [Candidatus Cloacimonadota bacterium]|nr:hypothetical protein [Candidatus Cloacimonadota bacterium]
MNTRFYLVIILMLLLFSAWTYLAHEDSIRESKYYEELSALPVYAYVADTTQVAYLLDDLQAVPELAELKHETGFQAALELISSYDLPLDDNMIADYSFPDLITITFQPTAGSIQAKEQVIRILQKQLQPEDIDSQEGACAKIIKRLEEFKIRRLLYLIFIAFTILILFINTRMDYEMQRSIKEKYKVRGAVDQLRFKSARALRTLLMLILPSALVIAAYYAGSYAELWQFRPIWDTFGTMVGVSVLASLILVFRLKSLDQAMVFAEVEQEQQTVPEKDLNDA